MPLVLLCAAAHASGASAQKMTPGLQISEGLRFDYRAGPHIILDGVRVIHVRLLLSIRGPTSYWMAILLIPGRKDGRL